MRVAISGFRHGHISSIAAHIRAHPELDLVAAAEEEPQSCAELIACAGVEVKYRSLDDMLDAVDFDILAVGDVFSKRGAQVIKALRAGKHVVGDKPLCTRLEELEQIRSLAESRQRSVIVALTCRHHSCWQTTRRLLHNDAIGEIATMAVFGHHPLSFRAGRPDWYFEPGKQGGTINDLLIHGIDGIRWMTGLEITEVVAARAWNAEIPEAPFFQDAAQAMLKLQNNAGVIADCSYKTPRKHSSPWTFHFWGNKGCLKLVTGRGLTVRLHDEPEQQIAPPSGKKTSFLDDLVAEINGRPPSEQTLTTSECLLSTEKTLRIQEAADLNEAYVPI